MPPFSVPLGADSADTRHLLFAILLQLGRADRRSRERACLLLQRAAAHAGLAPAERDACAELADHLAQPATACAA